MSLARRCRAFFSPRTRARGEAYFRSGRLEDMEFGENELTVRVAGSADAAYDVLLRWGRGSPVRLQVACTCPAAEREYCKHVWAVILALDAASKGLAVPGTGPIAMSSIRDGRELEFEKDATARGGGEGDWDDGDEEDALDLDDERDLDDDSDDDDDFTLSGPGSFSGLGSPRRIGEGSFLSSAPRGPLREADRWRSHLTGLGHHIASASRPRPQGQGRGPATSPPEEIRFVVDPTLSVRWGQLALQFCQREMRKDGKLGALKSLRVSEHSLHLWPDSFAKDALALLLGTDPEQLARASFGTYAEISFTRGMLKAGGYVALLKPLAEAGLLALLDSDPEDAREISSLAWDTNEPWEFVVRVARDPKAEGFWKIEGCLRRGVVAIPFDKMDLILPTGLVVAEGSVGTFTAERGAAWILPLWERGAIRVPAHDTESMLEALWRMPHLPRMDLDPSLELETASPVPVPCVRLRPPRRAQSTVEPYRAEVFMDYAGQRVDPQESGSGILDPNGRRVLLRDLEQEAAALRRLRSLGFDTNLGWGFEWDKPQLGIAGKHVSRAITELVDAGWQVEMAERPIHRASQVQLAITSGVDWFELRGEVSFGGKAAPLPKLLRALREGQTLITLDDGSQGLLPQDLMARYASLAALGTIEKDGLRFKPSQAMLIDALLSGQDELDVDPPFAAIRAKLHRFEGIHARPAPAAFQGTLREYQSFALGWFEFLREFGLGGCLADDMGLGKTVEILAMLQQRREERDGDGLGAARPPSLVVVPRSLVFNWIAEAQRFTPGLRVLDYTGLQRQERLDLFGEQDLIVTTYGTLRRDVLQLRKTRFDYVILDEAQAIKNANSLSAKCARLLACDHRLALTGTPIENHLGELWSLFDFLNPGMLGSVGAFRDAIGGRDLGEEGLAVLSRALRPFILRRTKEQVLQELPAKTEQTLVCEMDAKQRKLYNELRDHYRLSLAKRIEREGWSRAKIHVLEALLRLRQAACHPGLLDPARADQPSAKLDVLEQQIREVIDEGHKAIVFSQFVSLLTLVRRRLDRDDVTYEYLDGKTQRREEKVRRFQTDEACRLFLVSLKAGGQGLNLTAADYVFILDPWWNPAVEAQAVDRAHRIGQTRPVFAYRLIAKDTVEEKIVQLQQGKRRLAEAILQEDAAILRTMTAEDLRALLS